MPPSRPAPRTRPISPTFEPPRHDLVGRLRAYDQLAPWNLRDLAALAGALLTASRVKPVNAAASALPSERTIRYYVSRNLVTPPEGRGTAATYGYRHLLQVLTIKLHQMKGETLDTIAREMAALQGDQLERRTAMALGPSLPPPDDLTPLPIDAPRRRGSSDAVAMSTALDAVATAWTRVSIDPGLEIHVAAEHPLARSGIGDRAIADAVRRAIREAIPGG